MPPLAPLGSLEALAMRLAVTGGLSQAYMPATFNVLLAAGLIDLDGLATEAGRARWAAYVRFRNDDAMRSNVLFHFHPDALDGLRRLARGEEIEAHHYELLRGLNGAFVMRRPNGLEITTHGRDLVRLADEDTEMRDAA